MKIINILRIKEIAKSLIFGPNQQNSRNMNPKKAFCIAPIVNEKKCIGCSTCTNICPAKAISLLDNKETKIRTIIWNLDKCIFCGECEKKCLTKAGIQMSQETNLATTTRANLAKEHCYELILCHKCNEIISTKKHLIWTYNKLGPLAFCNQTLLYSALPESPPHEKPTKNIYNNNTYNAICPNCRKNESHSI
jgi:hydrogenase-4 component H